jgi:hypothetical protein
LKCQQARYRPLWSDGTFATEREARVDVWEWLVPAPVGSLEFPVSRARARRELGIEKEQRGNHRQKVHAAINAPLRPLLHDAQEIAGPSLSTAGCNPTRQAHDH